MSLPLGILVSLLLSVITRKTSLTFHEASLLSKLAESIFGALGHKVRYCTSKKYECTFKNGSCIVLIRKGQDWTYEDIVSCPYRKLMEDKK